LGGSSYLGKVRDVPLLGQSVNEYLFENRQLSSFERLAASSNADVIVFGHTHAVEFIRLSYGR
jgi:predicted phosphodiesterase